MTNYSDNDSHVRVDFFKPSGKWYTTEAIPWKHWGQDMMIHDAFRLSLRTALKTSTGYRLAGMKAVCLEPYHEHNHPLMIDWDG